MKPNWPCAEAGKILPRSVYTHSLNFIQVLVSPNLILFTYYLVPDLYFSESDSFEVFSVSSMGQIFCAKHLLMVSNENEEWFPSAFSNTGRYFPLTLEKCWESTSAASVHGGTVCILSNSGSIEGDGYWKQKNQDYKSVLDAPVRNVG